MRHMRSRRILAMLLALSMIFGLLTTTAFAGEVDQNPSNVGESAANGTSESGSGEGQSSGASDGQPSQETNKEDVPTEEETIPEEKKTTSDEEVDTQEGEEPTPVETQLTNYVMVGGIAGFEDTKFASFEAAYEAIKPTVATLGLIQESPANAAAFDAVFTDVQDGIATLTYTIAGNITYDETNLDHLLTMGRQSSHYLTNERHLINFKFVGANGDRADTLTINSDITLPYEWWGENTTTSISFEDLTITGSAPNGLYPYQSYFEGIDFTVNNCTLKGIKIYNCANVGGSYTITNSTLNGMGAAANAYAIHLQGHETAPLTITISGNEIFGYDRGINIDQKTANATISGNAISVNDSGRSCIQLTQLATTEIKGNTLALTGGNALTLHNNLLKLSTAPEISIIGNTISGTGYLIYDDAAANNSAFTADTLKLTYGTNTVDNTVDMTQGVKDSTVVEAGSAVQDAIKGTTSNAVTTSEELADAIANASDGDTIKLAAGEFTTYGNQSPKKSLIFVGSGEGTVWTIGDLDNTPGGEKNGDYSFDGCDTITFKNMTLKSDGADYRGFIRISNTIVDDCVLSGKTAYWGYETAKFINSKFNAPEGDYALWDYSSKSMSFDGCEFNISGKGVNVYVEAGNAGTDARKVEVKDCTVNSTKANKAFLNIKNSTQAYDVTISGNNTVKGLADNSTTGSNLYQVETTEVTEASGKPLTVKQVDAEGNETILYQVKKQTGVATVGGVSYDTLEEAFAALSDTAHTLTLNDESAWDATTPVYWAAGEQNGYAATLAEALTAAYKADAGNITIVCRPSADVGTMTHGHVADDLTIYGNNAYVSAGECDLEVDTYKYDRSTGMQYAEGTGTDADYLGKDITITAYELDNLGVWGQRHTSYTVNVNLTDCDTVSGITVQRVYISGTTGTNNITLSGCDFETKATSVYSNADGKIEITDCTFTGAQVPVNFNHKANGEQTVTVTNSTFTSCGDNGDWKQFAAPVRFVNSGSGSQTATVDTCKFTDTVGSNGDILIGDGRAGEKSNDVSLTVTNTEANIQAQQPGYYNGNETDTSKLGTATSPASGTLTTSVEKLISGGSTETTNVAKVGETEYETLAQAIAAADENSTVTLLNDTTEDVTIDKNITLDLGGKTLTNTGAGKATVYVPKDVKATVKNGIVMGGASYYNIAVGTEAAPGGELTLIGVTATAGNDDSSMIDNWGTLTIESGTYTGGLNVVKSEPNAVLTITGGKFTLNSAVAWSYTGVILTYGTAKIEGGEFVQNATTPAKASPCVVITAKEKVDDPNPSTEITGGTFTNNHTSSTAKIFHGMNKATSDNFEVKGGTFNKSIPEGYCADGFIPTKKADGTYGVKEGKYVVSVGSKNYETLADAIRLAAKGKTVMLLDDVTENIEIAKAKNFTLDLNGHTINGGTVKDKATITNYGTVTITDSSAAQNGTIKRDDNGTVGETSYYVIRNIGTMTIEQANVTNNSGYKKTNPSGSMVGSSLICNGDDDLGGTLNISGGKFEQRNFIAIKNGALGKLNVTGGTISSGHSAIQNWFEATITGGEINGQLWTDAYIKDESVGHTTIGGSAKYTGEIVMDISGSVKPTLEISGGDLNVTNWRITTAAAKAGAKPAVSGGKFTSAVPENYCADGYVPTKNEDGTYGVKVDDSVAEVGGVKYLSLQAALDAAIKGQTVKLLNDTKENVTISKMLTLDLNGHTLNGGQVKGTPALTVTARVTVKDSSDAQTGKIMREDTAENSGVSSHYVIDVQGAGWLTFEGGNVTNKSGNDAGKGASLVRVGDDSVEKYPGLNIKGGTFQQDNFIAIKVDRGDLFLNGGTITSENSYAIENWHRATIKGGIVNGTVASWTYSDGANSTTTISGGTVNGNVASVTYDKSEGKKASVSITGGTVTGTLGTYSYSSNGLVPLEDPAKATIGVTGGTFNNDPTKYVVEGSTVKSNTDGTFGVEKAYLATVGDTSYYTMEEAFKAQTASGEAIVLLRDYTTGTVFPSGSINRTVDLNNHTWTYTGTDTNSAAFEINYPNVTLTVKNGKVVSNSMVGLIPSAMGGTITYDNSGLVFESVEATANGNSGIETNGNNTNDTVTLKNSTLNVPNGFGIYFPSSGTLTIENSQITAKTLGVQVCSGSLDIKGTGTKIEVTGDGVEKTENDGAIQDGAAISIVNRTGYKGLGTIAVADGTFTAKSGNEAVKAYNWSNKEPGEANFTASDKVAISGGSYSTPVRENLCAEGFVPVTNGDGTYGVQPDGNVAEIGSVKYASLDEALKAAKDRETVKLLKDVEATQVLVTKGTLDLNGKTLKVSYFMSFSDVIDSTEGNGLIETGVQSFFTTNNSYLPLRDSAANGYRLFSYKLNKLGVVEGSSTAFWFNIIFGGEKAYSLLNTAGHNADLFIPMQIGSGNEWQYIKMNQSTLMKWTTPILNGTAPSRCGYYVNITGLNTLTSGTVLTLKTSIRSCGVEKLSDDSLTYTVK